MFAVSSERRRKPRLHVGFYAHELVNDEIHRCFTVDLSPTGVRLEHPMGAVARPGSAVQMELPLPGTRDPIWARGELVHESAGSVFHTSAVRFTTMASSHRRALAEWLREMSRSYGLGEVVKAADDVRIHRPIRL
jgi:hypothetical protein